MDSPLDKVSRDAKGSVRLAFVAMAPLPRGLPIHEGHALLDPVEQEGAGALVAVVGRGEDHAIAGERLMAVLEHEEMFRAGQQSFVIDVAMMAFVEPVVDGRDQPTDNVLQGFERTVDLGNSDGPVLGIDDNDAHGKASGSWVGSEPGGRSSRGRVHSSPAGLSLWTAVRKGAGI